MKTAFYLLISLASVILLSRCADCDEDDQCESTPFHHWDSSLCSCECDGGSCQHGAWNDLECKCDCYDNWSGANCNHFNPSPDFHADISINGASTYSFNPGLDIELIDNVTDTIVVDGYIDNGPGDDDNQFVYMVIPINDIHQVIADSTFDVIGNYEMGKCWASYHDPELSPEYFNAQGTTAGTVTITALDFNYDNNGSNFLSGTFEFTLLDMTGNTAHITGYFDGDEN